MNENDFGMIIEQVNEYGNPEGYSDEQLFDLALALKIAYSSINKAWEEKHLCSNCNFSRSIYLFTLGNGTKICGWCGSAYE